jgi:hypothetical protein
MKIGVLMAFTVLFHRVWLCVQIYKLYVTYTIPDQIMRMSIAWGIPAFEPKSLSCWTTFIPLTSATWPSRKL